MKKLLDGIKSRFTGDSNLSAFGDPYFAVLPEPSSPPMARINILSGDYQTSLDGKYVDKKLVQITLFHTDYETLLTAHEAVKTRFDRQPITIASGETFMSCVLTNDFIDYGGATASNGEMMYASMTEWMIQLDRAR